MPDPDPERAEECRYTVRHHLATRSTLAQPAATVHRSLSRKFDFTLAEVEAALVFLAKLGHLEVHTAALGSTRSYQISAAGQLADERGD